MRKSLIPVLMACVLMPAAAHAEPGDRGVRAHGERSESDDSSSTDRPQHVQRIERSSNDTPRVHVERAERAARGERKIETEGGEPTRVRRVEHEQSTQPAVQGQQVEQVRRTDQDKDGFVGAIRRAGEREATQQQQGELQTNRDRDGFTGLHDRIVRNGERTDTHRRWSRDWRHNHRYDWYSYRSRYSSLFRLGNYYDPYGWNYRRFPIGYSLWPSYYGSSYWLNDPWQYRLPPAYGPYRWVRYYDDALLVNIYTGQVVDVVYNFFW